MSSDEARLALSFFDGVDVWSPANPEGEVVAMLIVEDPDVFDELEEIAGLEGYSALVCGIGSLTSALNGDREAAEAIALEVLAASQRAGMVDLMTVSPESVAERVAQGFLALLAYGPDSDEAIRLGKIAAGR
jgi:2-keto-3-deoxy-L-rhamnonate aldolase RhmA